MCTFRETFMSPVYMTFMSLVSCHQWPFAIEYVHTLDTHHTTCCGLSPPPYRWDKAMCPPSTLELSKPSMQAQSVGKDQRVSFRVSSETKSIFERAASFEGRTMTDFVVAKITGSCNSNHFRAWESGAKWEWAVSVFRCAAAVSSPVGWSANSCAEV